MWKKSETVKRNKYFKFRNVDTQPTLLSNKVKLAYGYIHCCILTMTTDTVQVILHHVNFNLTLSKFKLHNVNVKLLNVPVK